MNCLAAHAWRILRYTKYDRKALDKICAHYAAVHEENSGYNVWTFPDDSKLRLMGERVQKDNLEILPALYHLTDGLVPLKW